MLLCPWDSPGSLVSVYCRFTVLKVPMLYWYFISWVKGITEQEPQRSLQSYLMMPPPSIVSNSRIYIFNLMFHAELFVLILNQEE